MNTYINELIMIKRFHLINKNNLNIRFLLDLLNMEII